MPHESLFPAIVIVSNYSISITNMVFLLSSLLLEAAEKRVKIFRHCTIPKIPRGRRLGESFRTLSQGLIGSLCSAVRYFFGR